MKPWKYPGILARILLPGAVFFADPADGAVYLTYDDGPDPEVTPQLLDVLARYRAQATFFVVANSGDWWPELIREIDKGGHRIGLHGLRHESKYLMTNSMLHQQLDSVISMIQAAGVKVTAAYRPPFGHIRPDTILSLRLRGIRTILWSKMPGDYRPDDLQVLFNKAIEGLRNGDVITLHDGTNLRPAPVLELTEELLKFFQQTGKRCSALNLPYLNR
ncbi:MAG: polysaccharide deacetylase family protein [bacterium]|nr:polysaccharide deacetylase family protein [bacterium]